MVAASGSSSGLPPKGSAGADVEPSTTGGDGDGAAVERGRNGVDLTKSNEASSSSWTTWAASFLGFSGQSRAQWPVLPHRRH